MSTSLTEHVRTWYNYNYYYFKINNYFFKINNCFTKKWEWFQYSIPDFGIDTWYRMFSIEYLSTLVYCIAHH